jgi:transposase
VPCARSPRATGTERPRLRYGQNERGLALPRKNFLFAGADSGGERAAIAYTIFGSCRLAGVEPLEYLADVLPKLTRRIRLVDLPSLLPSRWAAARAIAA